VYYIDNKHYERLDLKLKEIADIRTGLVLSRKKATLSADVKIDYKLITLKSFSNTTSLTLDDIDNFVSTEEIADTYLSHVGDVVVRLREPIAAVYIDESAKNMVIPSLMAIVRVESRMMYGEFLAYYINSTTSQKMLEKEIKGTTIAAIKTKDLEDLEVVLPSLEEQKKVVAFMNLSQNEMELLDKLKKEKQQFSHAVLDTIIQSNKDKQ